MEELKNDAVACGKIIVGQVITPDGKIGSIHIPEDMVAKFRNVLIVRSIGPKADVSYFKNGKVTQIKEGDYVYCRTHFPIHATIDMSWVEPDQISAIKTGGIGNIISPA